MGADRARRGRNPGKTRSLLPLLTAVFFLIGLLAPTVGTATAPAPRFGVVAAHEAPWAAADLGVSWTVIPFRWDDIQPGGPADWNPPLSDDQLALEFALGRQVVGVLTGVPSWAADPVTGLPRGLEDAPDDPENLWAAFVWTVVQRYAGRIDHWVVWEGPDRPENWRGSAADFAGLLRAAWTAARRANSRAVVHLGAVSHWPDVLQGNPPFVRRLLDALATDPQARASGFYFDVLTLRVYDQPESLYDLSVFYRRLLGEYGLQKKIWVEVGRAVSEEGEEGLLPEEQAAFLIQALTLGIAGGAERMAVYRMVDEMGEAPYGLIGADGAPRPAFAAFQVAVTYLGDFRSARWERRDDVSVVVVDRGAQVTTVAWARTPLTQSLMLPAQTTRALLANARGEAWIVHPDRGYYLLTLPGCVGGDICRVGGMPLMLVEENGAGAVAFSPPSAVPEVVPSPPPTPMPTPTPTPTPIPAATLTPTPTPTPTATASPTASPTPTPAAMPAATVPEPLSAFLAGALLGGLGIAGLAVNRRPRRRKEKKECGGQRSRPPHSP
ncbi:MAG: hypothetical protein H5T61_01495 [Thermoflexales bacterium]|nr:hypothetical protein [Thermoflexales bacterium]